MIYASVVQLECNKILASCNDVYISGKSSGVLNCEDTSKIVIWDMDNALFQGFFNV